jgi:hypothetical protein
MVLCVLRGSFHWIVCCIVKNPWVEVSRTALRPHVLDSRTLVGVESVVECDGRGILRGQGGARVGMHPRSRYYFFK